jgi:dTDP-4-dehydrorhamnose reductase
VANIVILGATGQFGTSLILACERRNIEFAPISHSDLEITNSEAVRDLVRHHRPRTVINATGLVDIGKCEQDPDLAFAVNATAVRTLAEACADAGTVLVQTSTHLVFEGDKESAYIESDNPKPNSIYAASKLVGEHLAQTLCKTTYAVRFPTLFGTRHNSAAGFVEKMMARLARDEPVRVADDRIDSPTWAFDASNAILDMVEQQPQFGLYHISNQGPVSYHTFISRLAELIGSDSVVERAKDSDFPSHPAKPLKVAISSEKLPPLRSWDEALAAFLDQMDE